MPNFLILILGLVAGTFVLKFYRDRDLSLVATIILALIIGAAIVLIASQA